VEVSETYNQVLRGKWHRSTTIKKKKPQGGIVVSSKKKDKAIANQ